MSKVFTYQQAKIEELKSELKEWEDGPVGWCSVWTEIKLGSDTCAQFEIRGDVDGVRLNGECQKCEHWEKG